MKHSISALSPRVSLQISYELRRGKNRTSAMEHSGKTSFPLIGHTESMCIPLRRTEDAPNKWPEYNREKTSKQWACALGKLQGQGWQGQTKNCSRLKENKATRHTQHVIVGGIPVQKKKRPRETLLGRFVKHSTACVLDNSMVTSVRW